MSSFFSDRPTAVNEENIGRRRWFGAYLTWRKQLQSVLIKLNLGLLCLNPVFFKLVLKTLLSIPHVSISTKTYSHMSSKRKYTSQTHTWPQHKDTGNVVACCTNPLISSHNRGGKLWIMCACIPTNSQTHTNTSTQTEVTDDLVQVMWDWPGSSQCLVYSQGNHTEVATNSITQPQIVLM